MPEEKSIQQVKRENFMKIYKDDPILTKKLPEVAAGLMNAEFGINIYDHSHIPIVFTTGWKEILQKVKNEQVSEYAIDVCGVRLEYITSYSESDKPRNIEPQMFHVKTPLFRQQEKNATIGASYTDVLMQKYNSWRSVYALESLTSIENHVYDILLNEYGIDIMVPAAIYPLLGATYAAGIEIARDMKQPINLYNYFEIHIVEGDQIILKPLASIKQWIKDDDKK